MARLGRKMETARNLVPAPECEEVSDAEIGIIAFGSTDPAVQEGRARLEEMGITTSHLRLRAVPFSDDVLEFIRKHERIYVIEMNTDGQMRQLLQLAAPDQATKLISLAHNDGLPLSARWIAEALCTQEEE